MANVSDSRRRVVKTGRIEKEKNVTSKGSRKTSTGRPPLTPSQLTYQTALHRLFRLREAFTIITREKTQIQEENRHLKELLDQHNIPYPSAQFVHTAEGLERQQRIDNAPEVSRLNRTYDEIGVDFVLA